MEVFLSKDIAGPHRILKWSTRGRLLYQTVVRKVEFIARSALSADRVQFDIGNLVWGLGFNPDP